MRQYVAPRSGVEVPFVAISAIGMQHRVLVVFAFAKKVAAITLKWYLKRFASSPRSWCVMVPSIFPSRILCIFRFGVFGPVFGIRLCMAPQDDFRGGRIGARDPWYGLKGRGGFEDFKRWWHRKGKRECNGGNDIASRREAEEMWGEWEKQGRPCVLK